MENATHFTLIALSTSGGADKIGKGSSAPPPPPAPSASSTPGRTARRAAVSPTSAGSICVLTALQVTRAQQPCLRVDGTATLKPLLRLPAPGWLLHLAVAVVAKTALTGSAAGQRCCGLRMACARAGACRHCRSGSEGCRCRSLCHPPPSTLWSQLGLQMT